VVSDIASKRAKHPHTVDLLLSLPLKRDLDEAIAPPLPLPYLNGDRPLNLLPLIHRQIIPLSINHLNPRLIANR